MQNTTVIKLSFFYFRVLFLFFYFKRTKYNIVGVALFLFISVYVSRINVHHTTSKLKSNTSIPMPVFIHLLKMAAERFAACLILIIVCTHHIYGSKSFSSANGYSSGSLACKTYNTSKMDCSRRNLKELPVLDRNWTTVLDLSHNRLIEIHGEPFCNLSNLTHLDLSRNVISKINSTAFRGLHSLVKLDMSWNELRTLSSDVFSGLLNLVSLDMCVNPILLIPSQTLATLCSLQYLSMGYDGSTLDTTISDFDSLTKLAVLKIYSYINVTNTTFLPLAGLPIYELLLFPFVDSNVIDKTAFVPFTSAREVTTPFRALSALRYLPSPLQTLALVSSLTSFPCTLHNKTFQVLSKFNKSLTALTLYLPVRQIENDSFINLPNLVRLGLLGLIETIAEQSFRGLTALQKISLQNNRLTAPPADALNNIGKSTSLQYLDLSSNSISTIADDAFVSVSSLT